MTVHAVSKKYLFALCLFLLTVSHLNPEVARAQRAVKNTKICVDSEKNKLVLRRKCKAPRFTEMSPEALNQKTALTLINESFDLSLRSDGDISGNSVTCPEGSFVTGGGASVVNNNGLLPKTSIPRLKLTGWSASVEALQNNASGTLNIYAICSFDVKPLED